MVAPAVVVPKSNATSPERSRRRSCRRHQAIACTVFAMLVRKASPGLRRIATDRGHVEGLLKPREVPCPGRTETVVKMP
jgi:hypothetical protein